MTMATSLHAELVNLILFFLCIVKVLLICGLVAVLPLALVETLVNGANRGR
jgi:hypothetical protein